MATDTVSAFPPISFGYDECQITILDSQGNGITSGIPFQQNTKRYGMPFEEIDSTKERDNIQSSEKQQRKGRERDSLKENSSDLNGDIVDEKTNGESKKKRNTRKRNRSDMSPEELRRLRERERKAQQSRRDRIRAQKRQNRGWQDDDAAWEAFLDQTEEKPTKNTFRKQNSSMPSMVCQVETNHPATNEFKADNKTEIQDPALSDEKLEENIEQSESRADSTSNSGSLNEHHSSVYSSDDSSHDSKDAKKLSRRHYLPSEELEKLRKRERDAKRKQREKYRQVATELELSGREKHQNCDEEFQTHAAPRKPSESDEKISNEDQNSEHVNHEPQDYIHHHKQDYDHNNLSAPMHPRSHHFLSSPLQPPYHPGQSFYSKISPHGHRHGSDYYSPIVYMSEHHHHPYSPTEKHYIPRQRNLNYPHHDTHDRQREHYQHHFPPHFMPTTSYNQHEAEQSSVSSQKLKTENATSPPGEKKKMISRNVDRKKLSEEELEELRRRERDYQRERRARIRMEKAKSQRQQEHFHYKTDREPSSPEGYYPPLHAYHPHHLHHRHHKNLKFNSDDREFDRRYEDHFDHTGLSPRHVKQEKELPELEAREHEKELQVTIPKFEHEEDHNDSNSVNESDLLQVVPKTRECEENAPTQAKTSEPVTNSSPNATSSPTNTENKSKKSILETICSSLKKDSSEWTENDEDRLVVDIKEENIENNIDNNKNEIDDSIENEENLSKLKDELLSSNNDPLHKSDEWKIARESHRITEEQLERRRRSNREAQRRRRARLKMQGVEQCLDTPNNHASDNSKELDNKDCQLEDESEFRKVFHPKPHHESHPSRPNSLHMHHHDSIRPHYYHSKERHHHEFMQDKYEHYLPDPYYGKHIHPLVHSPHHRMRDIEDPRHHYRDYVRGHYMHDFIPRHYHHRAIHRDKERDFHHHTPHHHHSSHYHHHRQYHSTDHAHSHQKHSPPAVQIPRPNSKTHSDEDKPKKCPIPSPKAPSYENDNNTSKDDSLNDSSDALSKAGRKRKQYAPRRVMASANTTPEEEEEEEEEEEIHGHNDELEVTEKEEPSRVVILNEECIS